MIDYQEIIRLNQALVYEVWYGSRVFFQFFHASPYGYCVNSSGGIDSCKAFHMFTFAFPAITTMTGFSFTRKDIAFAIILLLCHKT